MQSSVLGECGAPVRAIAASSSLPTGAVVKSDVAELWLDASETDLSHESGKNNTLTKYKKHM